MDAAACLSSRVESRNNFIICIERLRIRVDFHASHAIMNDRCDDSDMESVLRVEGQIVEEFFAPNIPRFSTAVSFVWTIIGIFLLLLRNFVVTAESSLDVFKRDVVFFSEFPMLL